jgi:hypothetical protein
MNTITLPQRAQRVFDALPARYAAAVTGMQDGCYIVALTRRFSDYDATRVYVAPGGSWTHNPARCAQLAERFPENYR